MLLKPKLAGVLFILLLGITVAAVILGGGEAGGPGTAPGATSGLPDQLNMPRELRVARVAVAPEGRQLYAGSAACVGCHPAQASQASSRHARTLSPVSLNREQGRFRGPCNVVDPLEGTRYDTGVRGDRCVLRAYDAGRDLETSADYAFGAGQVGVTYVSRKPGRSLQLRLSWYAKHGWAFTPGLGSGSTSTGPLGEDLDERAEAACFSCHTTVLVRRPKGLDLGQSILSVGCESCHGPGRAHIEAAQRGDTDLRMVRLAPRRPEVTRFICAACHRSPSAPSSSDPAQDPSLPRLQNVALSLSRCAQEAQVSCMTCHDPHRNADETPRASYNAACRSCHPTPGTEGKPACPVKPKGDCISCHMPAQEIGLPNGHRFRNHWIKVWEE